MGSSAASSIRETHGRTVVVGLGTSGLAAVRHLHRYGIPLSVVDSREAPPELSSMTSQLPDTPVACGGFDEEELRHAVQIVLSPGVSPEESAIASARNAGVPILGEVELFARMVRQDVIAITGSNGKSTVTALLGEMMWRAGINVAVGGNLGPPALELLDNEGPCVVELSSFQLETLESLRPIAAAILNVAPDHLDRYPSFEAYRDAKARIINGAKCVVYDADDPWLKAQCQGPSSIGITRGKPASDQFGLDSTSADSWLMFGSRRLMRESEIRLVGRHNTLNVLAALALGHVAGIPLEPMCEAARTFAGLPHRCELVATYRGVRWFNDSKGTNVGATVAAIEGLSDLGDITLIAGGIIKEPDLKPLAEAVSARVANVILFGRDAEQLSGVLSDHAPSHRVESLERAVELAHRLVAPAGCVLFSPAAASFDMFDNYAARGVAFTDLVRELAQC
ncbi:MAG: UDP-N-acetylmuramoyl-L-alanine--D-glutamate ligase [Pseudomonadota bacterium]